jgi:hypothetical protein
MFYNLLEQEFLLHYFGKFTYCDIELMSTEERLWFMERLDKQLKKEKDEVDKIARRGKK